MGSATQSFAFYIICSLALPPAAELLAFLWLYNTCNVRSEKNIRKKEREINPKPPRRRRLRCPLPLLPAAPSRRQTSSQFLLSPPPVVAAPAAARRINVAPPFPRPCSLVLSSRHCRCRRCRRCCRRRSLSLLPSPLLLSSSSSSPRPPRPPLPPPPITFSTRSP